jgi:hypothetical protein
MAKQNPDFEITIDGQPYLWRLQSQPQWPRDKTEWRGMSLAVRHAEGKREAIVQFPADRQPRYGAPWPDDPAELQYAGCAQVCCDANEECPGYIDAEVCAADDTGACWTLSGPPVPQGWKLLLEDGCGEVPQCND